MYSVIFSFFAVFFLFASAFGFLIDIDKLPDSLWFQKAYEPKQIHLSFGDTVTDIMVTWVTQSKTKTSKVSFGINGSNKIIEGNQTLFEDLGKARRTFYIHRVLLRNLNENTTYEYKCGSDQGWSDKFNFTTPPKNSDSVFTFAIYGDLGVVNDISIPLLTSDVSNNMYNAIFHIGDIAYDMYVNEGLLGDIFMQMIQPIAAYVPYMTAVGNHEAAYDFLHYRMRFSMPGGTQGMQYSINIGPIHFVIFSSEVYYYFWCDILAKAQYEWLERDLQEATSPENRKERPWIIVMAHRPMYCSTNDGDDCRKKADRVRVGCPGRQNSYGLEKLFRHYSVDIAMFGHEHTYERTWPLYDYKVYNGTSEDPYHNPLAMIQIISGAAGCPEHVDNFIEPPPMWSAFRSNDYSYTRLKVFNKTHLYFEQISSDKQGAVNDQFWVSKDPGWIYPTEVEKEIQESPQ